MLEVIAIEAATNAAIEMGGEANGGPIEFLRGLFDLGGANIADIESALNAVVKEGGLMSFSEYMDSRDLYYSLDVSNPANTYTDLVRYQEYLSYVEIDTQQMITGLNVLIDNLDSYETSDSAEQHKIDTLKGQFETGVRNLEDRLKGGVPGEKGIDNATTGGLSGVPRHVEEIYTDIRDLQARIASQAEFGPGYLPAK